MDRLLTFDELWEGIKETGEEDKKELLAAEQISRIIESMVRIRKDKGLSQRELAKICGVKQSAIARMETLQVMPRLDTLVKIAQGLGAELHLEEEITKKYRLRDLYTATGIYEWRSADYYGIKLRA